MKYISLLLFLFLITLVYADTVTLKNGQVFTNVKVTTGNGMVSLEMPDRSKKEFKREEVKGIRREEVKVGAPKTVPKTESKPVVPTPEIAAVGLTWSAYEGEMRWHNAKSKCARLGMRLATKEELVALYNSGADWKNQGCGNYCVYWSFTEHSAERAYFVNMDNGDVNYDYKANYNFDVRCVR